MASVVPSMCLNEDLDITIFNMRMRDEVASLYKHVKQDFTTTQTETTTSRRCYSNSNDTVFQELFDG
jgi:hypothetical protein